MLSLVLKRVLFWCFLIFVTIVTGQLNIGKFDKQKDVFKREYFHLIISKL